MIIDCHCHAGKSDSHIEPGDTNTAIALYLKRARAAGIDKTVVFSPFHSNYEQANANTAQIADRYPGRFLCFAFVHPRRDRGRIRQIVEQAVVKWGFCGIKAHRTDGSLTREICEVARVFRLPVLYDAVGKPDLIDLLACEYPEVNFIIPHIGSFADDWRSRSSD